MWTDLITTQPGDDIFIDTSVAGEVTIRWQAHTFTSIAPCNFSVTLFESGRIRFDYGAGNVLDDGATVGIGRGHSSDAVVVPGYDGSLVLTNEPSVNFARQGSALPAGMWVDASGLLQGIPLVSGSFQPTIEVLDEVRNCHRVTFRARGVGARQPDAGAGPRRALLSSAPGARRPHHSGGEPYPRGMGRTRATRPPARGSPPPPRG